MPERKAPSEGQKVNLGKQAPVKQEGSGVVPPDSLAAESQTFQSQNRTGEGVDSSSASHPQQAHSSSSTTTTNAANNNDNKSSSISSADTGRKKGAAASVEPAPTYVHNVLHNTDSGGPHGKNLQEDNSLEGGKNASFTEFGTANDPGRLAEQKFALGGSTPAVSTGVGRQQGTTGTPYDALSSDKEA